MAFKQLTLVNYLLIISVACMLSCSKSLQRPSAPPSLLIPSVMVCSQTWMTKNLDVVTFRNGDTIAQVAGDDNWGNMTIQSPTPAWCYFLDDASNDSVYGKLYNWAAVTDPRGLAPEGWHVATYADWTKLADSCLDGTDIAGKAMKEAGFAHWKDIQFPKYYGTNSSGLTCLPGGYRDGIGFDNQLGVTGNWWCGTGDSNGNAYMIWLSYLDNEVHFKNTGNDGVSVRCVKD